MHLSNLQRQILFTSADIDRPKAAAAQTRLSQLNPQIKLVALQQRLSGEALRAEVAKADVVLDCTDNMVTRQAINAACVALDTPLVTASAVGFGGQLMVLTPPWTQERGEDNPALVVELQRTLLTDIPPQAQPGERPLRRWALLPGEQGIGLYSHAGLVTSWRNNRSKCNTGRLQPKTRMGDDAK